MLTATATATATTTTAAAATCMILIFLMLIFSHLWGNHFLPIRLQAFDNYEY